ncbi:LacI family DNA-binding transcriptional regulator [Paenibacillus frigoriresistens]|nr:LacI family DNA-binding transcriptional regulator [Paenibacillus frigoriresistens]
MSLVTVTRILNADKSLPGSKETEEKVWRAVHGLGYNQTNVYC